MTESLRGCHFFSFSIRYVPVEAGFTSFSELERKTTSTPVALSFSASLRPKIGECTASGWDSPALAPFTPP